MQNMMLIRCSIFNVHPASRTAFTFKPARCKRFEFFIGVDGFLILPRCFHSCQASFLPFSEVHEPLQKKISDTFQSLRNCGFHRLPQAPERCQPFYPVQTCPAFRLLPAFRLTPAFRLLPAFRLPSGLSMSRLPSWPDHSVRRIGERKRRRCGFGGSRLFQKDIG